MLVGVNRYAASEFLLHPGGADDDYASGLDLYKSLHFLTWGDLPMFAVGFITAFVVALIAIKTFLSLIKRISFSAVRHLPLYRGSRGLYGNPVSPIPRKTRSAGFLCPDR